MLTVLRVSFDELAWALPTAALRNMRYLGGSRGVILGAAANAAPGSHSRRCLLDYGCSRTCIIANSAYSTAKTSAGAAAT
jgi:hypothetical protein